MRPGSSAPASVAHTRLADGDRTDAGHHLALGQVPVPHDAPVAVRGLQIGMLARNSATSASTAWAKSARAPSRKISVSRSSTIPG